MTIWTVRPEQPADIAAIHALTAAAFGQDDEADLVDALRADAAWIGDLSMVAEDEAGPIIGHALLTRCQIDDVPALCLAPCSVLPDLQGAGVGTAVIEVALHAARAMGEAYVVVLGHPEYYPRFGFDRASLAGIRLSIEVPDEAMMALSLDESRTLPSGVVRYAAPFGI